MDLCELMDFVVLAVGQYSGMSMNTMKNLDNLDFESWSTWKVNFQVILTDLDINFALEEDEPSKPTDTSSPEEKARYEKWERSNYLSLSIMKLKMSQSIYGYLSYMTNSGNAKQMLDALKETIMVGERMHAPSMLDKLVKMSYDRQGNVQQHLNEMYSLVNRLKAVDVGLPEYLINQLPLNSLPSQFEPVKVACIMEKEKWGFGEIAIKCVGFEKLILLENKLGGKRGRAENENQSCNETDDDEQIQNKNGAKKRNVRCYSCRQKGHIAKNCRKVAN